MWTLDSIRSILSWSNLLSFLPFRRLHDIYVPVKRFDFFTDYIEQASQISHPRGDRRAVHPLVFIFFSQLFFGLHNLGMSLKTDLDEWRSMVFFDVCSLFHLSRQVAPVFTFNSLLYAFYYYSCFWTLPRTMVFGLLRKLTTLNRAELRGFLIDDKRPVIQWLVVTLNLYQLPVVVFGEYSTL